MQTLQNDFFTWLGQVHTVAPVFRVLLGIALVLCGLLGARFIRRIAQKIRSLTVRHAPEWLDILTSGFLEPFVLLIRCLFWYLAVFAFPLPTGTLPVVYRVSTSVLRLALIGLVTLGLWNSASLCKLLLSSARNRLDLESNQTMLHFFEKFYRALILVLVVITALNELGFNVNGLVTGAGLVGLTLSLAAQSTVSNLVAGVALVMERPFGIGDFITVGDVSGTVEDISFRTTRIRTTDNSLVSMENSAVCSKAITNIANRTSRLWAFTLGVTYSAAPAQLHTLMDDLSAALRADPEVLPDTVEVNLSCFADSSISVAVQCYVTATDIVPFRALKTRLNYAVMDIMARDGCAFAFPSTSVYVEQMPKNN